MNNYDYDYDDETFKKVGGLEIPDKLLIGFLVVMLLVLMFRYRKAIIKFVKNSEGYRSSYFGRAQGGSGCSCNGR